MNTLTDLIAAILPILPDAIFDQDSDGEITISTGYRLDASNNLITVEEV